METIQDDLRAQLADKTAQLLPLPQITSRILAMAITPSKDAAQLADLIGGHPTLASQVTRAANLPFYRAGAPMQSLRQVIGWLGVTEVQNLTMALTLRGEVFKAPGHEADIEELWRESLAAAMWAKKISEARGKEPGLAYLCGLLHQIGRVAVVRVLSRAETERRMVCDARSFALLLDEFELDFARHVATRWELAQRIGASVLGWRSYEILANHRQEAAVTHAAHQLATASLHPALMQVEYLLSNPVFAELKLDSHGLEALLGRSDEIRDFVAAF